jgi:hypothetical protein
MNKADEIALKAKYSTDGFYKPFIKPLLKINRIDYEIV